MLLKYSRQPRVPLDEAKRRALAYLQAHPRELMPASWVAQAIWPEHQMKAQGAGAAAVRILKHLERDGLVCWTGTRDSWGWKVRQGIL